MKSRLVDEYPSNEMFGRKGLPKPYLFWGILLARDVFYAWILVLLFNPDWDYPLVIAFFALQGLAVLSLLIRWIFERIFDTKDLKLAEVRHYVALYSSNGADLSEVATYDDLHYDAAFSEGLSVKLRVLAAINYGVLTGANSFKPGFINKFDSVFIPYFEEWWNDRND